MTAHTKTTDDPWAQTLSKLKQRLDEYTYTHWFESTRFLRHTNGKLEVEVPTQYFAQWLRNHYTDEISECMAEVIPEACEVVFQPMEEGSAQPRPETNGHKQRSNGVAPPASRPAKAPRAAKAGDRQLSTRYTFDRFVVGSSNRFAHAAAYAVAESPAMAYNPLFLHGGTGLGKTHLMHAIGHEAMRRNPQARIVLVSSEFFMNELIEGIRQRSTESFRARYRKADILLIDDIHFIAGKDSTQEEFFHTFNALYEMRKQIVISSDRQPKEIAGLEARLVSRFESGLVTDIQAPDIETRTAILQTKAAEERADIPAEVLRFIATYITSNIRELEGALITVLAYSRLSKVPITMPLVENVLADSIGKERIRPITVDAVLRAVGEHFDLRLSDLRGRTREKQITRPRHIAMYLCKRMIPTLSLNDIGEAFGGKDHTTVLHGCRRIEKALETESDMRQIVNHLEKQIRS